MQRSGITFLTGDEGGMGDSAPAACTWDDGPDPVQGLVQALEVRRAVLARMAVQWGSAQTQDALRMQFTAAYLWHRYQVECVVKSVGGLHFQYAAPAPTKAVPVPFAAQQRALRAVLDCVRAEELHVPLALIQALGPANPTFENGMPAFSTPKEWFDSPGGRDRLDPFTAAYTVASLVFGALLHPQRVARLVTQEEVGDAGGGFGLYQMLAECVETVFPLPRPHSAPAPTPEQLAPYQRAAQRAFVDAVLSLKATAPHPMAHALVQLFLADLLPALRSSCAPGPPPGPPAPFHGSVPCPAAADLRERAHRTALENDLARGAPVKSFSPQVPMGSPI